MNAGAYDHEEEVLLYDGARVEVLSVKDKKDDRGKKIYTLISCAKYTNNSKNFVKKNQKINREGIDLTYI